MRSIAFLAFVGLAVAANWLTSTFGMVPVGFGLVTTAGTFAAGLVLLARDVLQDLGGRWWVLAAIAVGAGASAWLAGPALALASGAAFGVSELADAAVYTPLRKRGWARAAALSGLVGSAVDSVLFLWLAGFPILVALPGQMLVKVGVTLAVVAVVVVARAVLRDRLRPKGA